MLASRPLEALARDRLERLDPKLSAAILVIDNGTGEVMAQVGSPDHMARERSGAIDMTLAFRSPGSALKPFIYASPSRTASRTPRRSSTIARPLRPHHPENFDSPSRAP